MPKIAPQPDRQILRRGPKPRYRVDLTDELLSRAERRQREYTIFDHDRGFSARVRETGSITLHYRPHPALSRSDRKILGRFPQMSVAEARAKIARFESSVETSGVGLLSANTTFAEAATLFLREGEGRWRDSYHTRISRAFKNTFVPSLGNMSIEAISPDQIRAAIAGKARSFSALKNDMAKVSAFLSWCVRKGALPSNALRGSYVPVGQKHGHAHWHRLSNLSVSELREAYVAASAVGGPEGRLIRLIILTGLHPHKIVRLAATDIDARMGTVEVEPEQAIRLGPESLRLLSETIGTNRHRNALLENGMRPKEPCAVPRAIRNALGGYRLTSATIARSVIRHTSAMRLNLIEWESYLLDIPTAWDQTPEGVEL